MRRLWGGRSDLGEYQSWDRDLSGVLGGPSPFGDTCVQSPLTHIRQMGAGAAAVHEVRGECEVK